MNTRTLIRRKRAAVAAALLLVLLAPAARAGAEPALLKENVPTPAVLDLEGDGMVRFRVEVPKDAVLMSVAVTRSPVPLDVLARKDRPIEYVDEADHQFSVDVLENALRVSRQSSPPLEEGTWHLAVSYLGVHPAVVHKRPVKKVPFTATLTLVRAKPAVPLVPGKKAAGRVLAEEGSVRTFVVDVPEDAKALRIDLDEVSGDLDLLARYGRPAIRNDDAGDAAISPLGRESLVIGPDSPEPLRAGKWYVHVVHPLDYGTVDFHVHASFSPDPPAALLAVPELPQPADARKRAVAATVDVATEFGAASGTLVTAGGLVLTNYHVVAEVAETPDDAPDKDPVVVAVTLDPREPPKELFRGRVLHSDKLLDLALVQITCGLYRQPLPPGYRFPSLPLGDPATLEIGDPLAVVGFPSVGGSGGRVSVTYTRGVLSGFEKLPFGAVMKTDANIGPGSSGGAALDAEGRLIGVPTSENVLPESVGRMSYVHPVSLIPETWRALLTVEKSP